LFSSGFSIYLFCVESSPPFPRLLLAVRVVNFQARSPLIVSEVFWPLVVFARLRNPRIRWSQLLRLNEVSPQSNFPLFPFFLTSSTGCTVFFYFSFSTSNGLLSFFSLFKRDFLPPPPLFLPAFPELLEVYFVRRYLVSPFHFVGRLAWHRKVSPADAVLVSRAPGSVFSLAADASLECMRCCRFRKLARLVGALASSL